MINLKTKILCEFIYNTYEKKSSYGHDLDFILQKLNFANNYFKINSAQILVLCLQDIVYLPLDIKKSNDLTIKKIKTFLSSLKKNKNKYQHYHSPFLFLPDHAFSSLTFNKVIKIIKELNNKKTKNLSTDAKVIWDINHFYYSLNFEEFLYFIDEEYDLIKNQLTEDEYLFSKKNQFLSLLSNKNIFQTKIFCKILEKNSRKNLLLFINNINISSTIQLNS